MASSPLLRRRLAVFCLAALAAVALSAAPAVAEAAMADLSRIQRVRTDRCAAFAVGRLATTDGSTMVTHTDDMGFVTSDIRLIRTPGMEHPPGSQRAVYAFANTYPRLVTHERSKQYVPTSRAQNMSVPIGYIPQVERTFGYWETDYGMMNEHQLSIGESTCASKAVGPPLQAGGALFEVEELTRVALERCTSARCAILTMGDLATTYGFSTIDREPGDSAEGLAIADGNEAWIFHVMPSPVAGEKAIWVAQRVPDDQIAVMANMFIIRSINLEDPKSFLASANVKSAALKAGWWDGVSEFDFTRAYAYQATAEKSAAMNWYSARRIWRAYDLLAPSLKLDAELGHQVNKSTYPFSIRPDARVSPQAIMRILRDHLEGTKYDLTKSPAAGPFGSPVRFTGGLVESKLVMDGNWEYSISLHRTIWSFICQSRRDIPGGGVLWHGLDSPHGTVFVPFFAIQEGTPKAWQTGKQSAFSRKSAYWAFNFVNNWILLRYNAMIVDVRAAQARLESAAASMVEVALQEARTRYPKDPADAAELLEKAAMEHAEYVLDEWWALADLLIGKYSSGYITTGEGDREAPGYPFWFLCQSGTFFNFPHGLDGAAHAGCPPVPKGVAGWSDDHANPQHAQGGLGGAITALGRAVSALERRLWGPMAGARSPVAGGLGARRRPQLQ